MALDSVLGLVGGLVGSALSDWPRRHKAEEAWQNLRPYDVNELKSQWQTGPSAFETGLTEDPFYDTAAREAVADLIRRGQSFGKDPEMEAALGRSAGAMRAANRGAQGAIAQKAQETNSYGGPANLMNQMMAQQGAYEQAGMAGAEGAAVGAQNRLANTKAGMEGAFQGSKVNLARKGAIASAKDEVTRYNAMARQAAYREAWNQMLQKTQGYTNQLNMNVGAGARTGAAGGMMAGSLLDYGVGGAGKAGGGGMNLNVPDFALQKGWNY